VALILTRKQSMRLGLGLLAAFFIGSGAIIYSKNASNIPASSETPTQLTTENITTPSPKEPQPIGLGFVLNDFHRSLERDGKVVWDIVGKRGQYNALTNSARIEEARLIVVQADGELVTLTAKHADLILSGTELTRAELSDDVVVIYKDNTTLTTSRAIYEEKTGRVEIPVPLVLENPMFTLTGKQAVALVESQDVTISNGVKTMIKPRKK
jgi:LPS export ABC transporter protein LptC